MPKNFNLLANVVRIPMNSLIAELGPHVLNA